MNQKRVEPLSYKMRVGLDKQHYRLRMMDEEHWAAIMEEDPDDGRCGTCHASIAACERFGCDDGMGF